VQLVTSGQLVLPEKFINNQLIALLLCNLGFVVCSNVTSELNIICCMGIGMFCVVNGSV
jgi:hypothetical protein